jgi:hypothetical protein
MHSPRDVLLEGFPPLLHHVGVHVTEKVLLGQCVDDTGLGWIGSPELTGGRYGMI